MENGRPLAPNEEEQKRSKNGHEVESVSQPIFDPLKKSLVKGHDSGHQKVDDKTVAGNKQTSYMNNPQNLNPFQPQIPINTFSTQKPMFVNESSNNQIHPNAPHLSQLLKKENDFSGNPNPLSRKNTVSQATPGTSSNGNRYQQNEQVMNSSEAMASQNYSFNQPSWVPDQGYTNTYQMYHSLAPLIKPYVSNFPIWLSSFFVNQQALQASVNHYSSQYMSSQNRGKGFDHVPNSSVNNGIEAVQNPCVRSSPKVSTSAQQGNKPEHDVKKENCSISCRRLKEDRIYVCSFCTEIFANHTDVKLHTLRTHHEQHPYFCYECKTGFYSLNKIDFIKVADHVCSKSKALCCTRCSRVFHDWDTFLEHAQFHTQADLMYKEEVLNLCRVYRCRQCYRLGNCGEDESIP